MEKCEIINQLSVELFRMTGMSSFVLYCLGDKNMTKLDYLYCVFSYALTTNCFRNLDVVENSHACKPIVCDNIFCQETYDACARSISEWVPRLIDEFIFLVENNVVNDSAAAFVLGTSVFTCKSLDWPMEISDEYNGDIAGFLLAGTFRKACQEGWILGDESMNKINHDVNNRMYTLIKSGVINIDLSKLK